MIKRMNACERCHTHYLWEKSTSVLKMTFCSILCEIGQLGFSIDGAITMERQVKPIVSLEENKIEPVIVQEKKSQDNDRKELMPV